MDLQNDDDTLTKTPQNGTDIVDLSDGEEDEVVTVKA